MRILADTICGRIGEGISSSLFWVPSIEVITWLSETKPTMDMFDEAKPDIVIVDSKKLSTLELKIAASRYPNAKIIAIGKIDDLQVEPHLNIAYDDSASVPTIRFEDGAMIGNIGSPPKEKCLHTDLLCLTDYINQDDQVLSMLDFLCENYNMKIFGNQKVNFPHYLGRIDRPTKAKALASTSVYVDLDGGSWYDAAWLGKECVSIAENCFRSFSNIEELKSSVDEALDAGETNSQEIKMMVKNQTYFELTGEILSFFGLTEQRNTLMEKKKDILC